MKKLLFVSLLMASSVLLANAQTVVGSDMSTPASSNQKSKSGYESQTPFSINHFLDFGKFNLSYRAHTLKHESICFDFGLTMADGGEFDNISTFSWMVDLGANYSVLLSSSEKTKLYLSLGLGPSLDFCTATTYDRKTYESKSKTKTTIDGYIYPNLTFMYKHISLSIGYYFRAPEFKFREKDGADGFFAFGIGWDWGI